MSDESEDEDEDTNEEAAQQEDIIGLYVHEESVDSDGEELIDMNQADQYLEAPSYVTGSATTQPAVASNQQCFSDCTETPQPSIRSTEPSSSQPLISTLSQNIAQVLGFPSLLYQFDQARCNLKKHPQSKVLVEEYEALLARVQTAILSEHSTLKKKLKEWEKDFFITNLRAPEGGDIDKEGNRSAYNKYKKAKDLLRHWRITIHL